MTPSRRPHTAGRRRRRRGASRRRDAVVATATVGLMLALLVLGATVQRGVPGRSHYDLQATFVDAANLGRYAEVRIAGRRVGQVLAVRSRAGRATVDLQLDDDVRPLREGTRARVRLKGLLGAKFVELVPASAGAELPDGGRIDATRTSTTVELADVLDSLDAPRRRALTDVLDAFGTGLIGRGPGLNEALERLPRGLGDLRDVTSAVPADSATRLVDGLERGAAAAGPAAPDVAAGWAPTGQALRPLADRAQALEATLRRAPATLDVAREGLRASDPFLVEAARLARAARRLTRPAPAALRETSRLLVEGRGPLADTRDLVAQARRAVDPTLALTSAIRPLTEPLSRALREAVPTLAMLRERRCDALGFSRNWRSMLAFGFDRGAPVGPETGLRVTVVSDPAVTPKQVIGDLPALLPRGSSYPPPCRFGSVTPLPRRTR